MCTLRLQVHSSSGALVNGLLYSTAEFRISWRRPVTSKARSLVDLGDRVDAFQAAWTSKLRSERGLSQLLLMMLFSEHVRWRPDDLGSSVDVNWRGGRHLLRPELQ